MCVCAGCAAYAYAYAYPRRMYVVFSAMPHCHAIRAAHHLRASFTFALFLHFFSTFVRFFSFMSTRIWCTCMQMALFFVAIFSASLENFRIHWQFVLAFHLWCRIASSIMIWLPLKPNILFSFTHSLYAHMYWWFCVMPLCTQIEKERTIDGMAGNVSCVPGEILWCAILSTFFDNFNILRERKKVTNYRSPRIIWNAMHSYSDH